MEVTLHYKPVLEMGTSQGAKNTDHKCIMIFLFWVLYNLDFEKCFIKEETKQLFNGKKYFATMFIKNPPKALFSPDLSKGIVLSEVNVDKAHWWQWVLARFLLGFCRFLCGFCCNEPCLLLVSHALSSTWS